MYTVIVCPECQFAQIVKDDPETTKCNRCTKALKFRKLKHFFQSDDKKAARDARAAVAAQEQGFGEEFDDLYEQGVFEDATKAGERIEDDFLAAHGLDADEMADRTTGTKQRSRSRKEIVQDAFTELNEPTEETILDYAVEHDVPRDAAEKILTRLREHGEVIESGGVLRLL